MGLFPLFPFLYAEIHYKIIPFVWSRFFKKEPEIITDTVWRLEPELTLPLLVFIKDSDRFNIHLEKIVVTIHSKGHERNVILHYDVELKKKIWWRVEYIEINEFERGQVVEIDTLIFYRDRKNISRQCRNDNYYKETPPFLVNISKEPLPKFPNWYQGDMHLHSLYTNDQIEFGAPLAATAELGHLIGLDFIGVTDHAYDLDDSIDNYMINDPDLPKWTAFKLETAEINKLGGKSLIIPGIEVSVENAAGKSVHLQLFNTKIFFPGSSDSGEKWLRRRPEWSLRHILDHLYPESLSCAAHIGEKPPLIQRLVLGRGEYAENDLDLAELKFFQLANGNNNAGLQKALKKWTAQLLKGRKVTPIAGSDSHGHFNISRYVVLPHFKLDMARKQLLGETRTALWSKDRLDTPQDVIRTLQTGNVQITSGPLLNVTNINSDIPLFGSTIQYHDNYIRHI